MHRNLQPLPSLFASAAVANRDRLQVIATLTRADQTYKGRESVDRSASAVERLPGSSRSYLELSDALAQHAWGSASI